jgi:eukaryotic-like serine/threonine-protein kinase
MSPTNIDGGMVHGCRNIAALLVRTNLIAADAERVRAHLACCAECREAVDLMRTDAGVGTVVEGYELVRVLGHGGTSMVYEAKHSAIEHRVAVKILRRELGAIPEQRLRFLRDAEIAGSLRGHHICRTNSLGELPSGEPYIVLEYLDGEDLQRTVDRGPVATPLVASFGLQVCEGLAEAHARGIVHRDLKPANLMVIADPCGEPMIKILDFGVAKHYGESALTATGVAIGSIPYMSPEQLRSSRGVDARADIWSLGATLHHLISGTPPFSTHTSPLEAAVRIWTTEPPRLGISFAEVIERCLAKRAEDRYPDVSALASALAAHHADGPQVAARVARILGGAG